MSSTDLFETVTLSLITEKEGIMTQKPTSSISLLRQEYEQAADLLRLQSSMTQRFVEAQAQRLGDALMRHATQARFSLPDQVLVARDETEPSFVPAGYRDQLVGRPRWLDRFSHTDLRRAVSQRLQDLELAASREASVAAKLLRHAIVVYLVEDLLPDGHTAAAPAGNGENIAEAACCGYMPQWVAFDAHDHLLVKSVREAEAQLAAMQRYMEILNLAQSLALYIVADKQYWQKYYGMLGQLVEQGRALARYEVGAIIAILKDRAARHELDQGLRLSVPYFDDQTLCLRLIEFEVIPAGRVMFVPTFVVKAAREEQIKVLADTRLSPATRQHLLHELKLLQQAFDDDAAEQYCAWQQVYEQPPYAPPSLMRATSK
jgi:hypothetical protein